MQDALIESAFVYAYPLYALALTRYRAVQDPAQADRHAVNTLRHDRRLCDHASRWITAPNNDTLYSNAWIDLSQGPVRVQVEAMPEGRYWSVALLDAYTNHVAMLGQRLDGLGPVQVCLVGPGQTAPDHERVIQAPGLDVWLFARCLVDGPDDLPAAMAMQDRIHVQAQSPGPWPDRVVPAPLVHAAAFLDLVNEALARNPPPPEDAPMLDSWGALGFRPGETGVWDRLDASVQAAWQVYLAQAIARLRAAGTSYRHTVQGWVASMDAIGQFGAHHGLRASVALGGLGALEPVEAMYFVRYQDAEGEPLTGAQNYTLHVPPEGLPTDSFWSFTMYEPTAEGQRFLVDNPIRRYSIGNRTPGLRYNADGSLDVCLQQAPPTDPVARANWLPVPAGVFQISLRTYLPRPSLRAGEATLPQVRRRLA